MKARGRVIVAVMGLLVLAVLALSNVAHVDAQSRGVAIRGTVSSSEEGQMEGVVVSARREGAMPGLTRRTLGRTLMAATFPAAAPALIQPARAKSFRCTATG